MAAAKRGGAGVARGPGPLGREPLARAFIEEQRRRRIVAVVAELAHEIGIGEMTVTRICQRAQVGRNSYYSLFSGVSGCLEYAFTEAFEQTFGRGREVGKESESWLHGLSTGIAALFAAIAHEPLLGELCLVHSAGAAAESAGHDYEAGMEVVAGLLGGGREVARTAGGKGCRQPPPRTEEFLANAIVSLARQRVQEGRAAAMPEHHREMVLLVVSAFFGAEAAGPS